MKKPKYRNAAIAYIKLRPLIIDICNKFSRKYGGNIEDYLSESNLHFMTIWNTHDPSRCSLDGDVVFRLWKKLEETKRTELRRATLTPRVPLETVVEIHTYESPTFDIIEFMEGLPVDAEELVYLLFADVPDIKLAVLERGEPSPKNIRHALKEFLRDCGWSIARITESFRDVRSALNNQEY